MKKAKDIMSEDVACLSSEDSIFDAIELFSKLDIHGAPVIENDKLVGMITVTDIIRFIDLKTENLPEISLPGISQIILALLRTFRVRRKFEEELKRITSMKVGEVMTKDPITVKPSTRFLEVVHLMDEHKIHRLPVVRWKKLVGIISAIDLMKAFIEPSKPKKSPVTRIKSRFKRLKSS